VPTTCTAQAKNCGSIADGCGGTLTCGTCTAPQTRGGAGTANVCSVAPPARVRADDVRRAGQKLWIDRQRLWRHLDVRNVHGPADLRRRWNGERLQHRQQRPAPWVRDGRHHA
jgi:hypothetical protein